MGIQKSVMTLSLQKNSQFWFRDELVLRTPALPIIENLNEEKIDHLLRDKNFMEAVYLASPGLYHECTRLINDELNDERKIRKIRTSLIKYYQRMYSRCTPFGLFAGCSLTQWGSEKTAIKLSTQNFSRSTRLDMHYLCALGQHLVSSNVIRRRLQYFPNNSLYRIGDEMRYIEYRYINGKRLHQISSVLYTDYLDALLQKASGGTTIQELTDLLVNREEVGEAEAEGFVERIIENQLLISELDPAITGPEFIYQLLDCLKRINSPQSPYITAIITQLEEIVEALKKTDSAFNNSPQIYISLSEKLKDLGVAFEENKLFQTDMYCRNTSGGIAEGVKQDLVSAVNVLAKIFGYTVNDTLSAFAERFRKRYEDQLVPLLQVLDVETGIGYKQGSGKNLSPLLANILLPPKKKGEGYTIKWNTKEQWLFDLLLQKKGAMEINISEDDLTDFTTDLPVMPPSMSLFFSLVEGEKIVLKNCAGSSAANILSRFAHGNNDIYDLVKKITTEEQQLNSDVIFAEIIHLPEDRIGNILLHPAFRNYEIPFLAQSSLPTAQQLPLQDILISVRQDNRIRLFSKSMNKEIIPRLTNAHNYSFESLPVYHFLADLQTQGLAAGWVFKWGNLARYFKYLPRVTCGNVILFEAEWLLRKEDVQQFFFTGKPQQEAIENFIKECKVPRYVVLVDGDNELLIDFESKESVTAFIKTIQERKLITLREFLWPARKAVTDEKGNLYNNQFIAVLMNSQVVYKNSQPILANQPETETIKRNFLPGSEWLYYKIFCGTKTADEILINCIAPFTEKLLQLKLIDKWFFVRYNEDGFHLRVRFHLTDIKQVGNIMQLFMEYTERAEKEGQVWKIQLDTYKREIERYKGVLTVLAEDLFFYDSTIKLHFLFKTQGDDREKYRWLWALRGIDQLLDAFNYSLESKHDLMQGLSAAFAKEFNADRSFLQQLNRRLNDDRSVIQMVMGGTVSATNEMKLLLDIYEDNKKELIKTAGQIINNIAVTGNQLQLNSFLESCIHMNLNRLFLSEPRLNETIIYYFLRSYYFSCMKKQENSLTKS